MPDADDTINRPTSPDRPGTKAYTVSQITARVKQAIRTGLPGALCVIGEISNLKRHGSGHLYFTLKDSTCELSCVMWRSSVARLKFEPRNGMEVLVFGEIDVFDRAGRYQLYARRLEPEGEGAIELAFRQRYEALKREGLFDSVHKRKLPRFPRHIALVTSPTGAVVHDILQTLRRRFPCICVSVLPVAVQGATAAAEIATAIDRLNRDNDKLEVDVIITARGGGSLEDLWAFNEEVLARAVFRSSIPIISAVGHETDVTICDLVADLRAATPTAAAELAVPHRQEVLDELHQLHHRLQRSLAHRVQRSVDALAALEQREPLSKPLRKVWQLQENLDLLRVKLDHGLRQRLHGFMVRLADVESTLQRIEPRRYVQAMVEYLRTLAQRPRIALQARVQEHERSLHRADGRLIRSGPSQRLAVSRQRIASIHERLTAARRNTFALLRERLAGLEGQLQSVSYRRTLARGYTVTRVASTGQLVESIEAVRPGMVLSTEMYQGSFESRVEPNTAEQLELFE